MSDQFEVTTGDRYRFDNVDVGVRIHHDGSEMPWLSGDLERREEDGTLKKIGKFRVRAQKVKRDESDVEDVELIMAVRLNPKKESDQAD